MLRPTLMLTGFLALAVAAIAALPACADFDGEVLIAPPPANWTGGTEEAHASGSSRVWRRPDGAAVETITLTRLDGISNADPGSTAVMVGLGALGTCDNPDMSEPVAVPADIGVAAAVTATCTGSEGVGIFAVGTAYVGEFNTYTILRAWYGDPNDPGSPANSPRAAEDWQTYFERATVCNTLTSPCDVDAALLVHAHPRFETMRDYQVAAAPVLDQNDLMRGARALGELTGRAAGCGEDITLLVSKIDRMFEHVTANDRDAFDAVAAFGAARLTAERNQADLPREGCGEILREYRRHPSRVGAFPRYIAEFF